jgi:hypothetical protein
MVKKGNMTMTTKVNAPNQTPTGSPKKTVTREYKKKGGPVTALDQVQRMYSKNKK